MIFYIYMHIQDVIKGFVKGKVEHFFNFYSNVFFLQEAEEKIKKSEELKKQLESKMKDTQSPRFKQLLFDRICLEIEKGTPEIISHRGAMRDTGSNYASLHRD